ncbi:nuclear transport factor 2 family protein, partial [candidate division KSB1 bacterium]|nr:nuclear transport factor 2 family protein [candidate division KSB1 bacterium]
DMTSEAAVLDAFHQIRAAFFACDATAIKNLIAENYYGINIYGQIDNRDMILEAYRPGQVRLEQFEVDDLQVRVFGVIGIMTGKGSICGRFGNDRFEHQFRFCDTYLYDNNRWQLMISQGTPIIHPDPSK